MKYSVIADAYATYGNDASVGLDYQLNLGDGFPASAIEDKEVVLFGVSYHFNAITITFRANNLFNATDPLPITSVTIIDPTIGTTTFLPSNVVFQSDNGTYALYAFSSGNPMTVGERVEVQIEFDDSLILPPAPSELAIMSPIMSAII
jgi:hypothetical protein